jgi:hypothetical protein
MTPTSVKRRIRQLHADLSRRIENNFSQTLGCTYARLDPLKTKDRRLEVDLLRRIHKQ